MRKSLQLQVEMTQELGACVFDVTLDCEDGAPVGGETDHAALVSELLGSASPACRVGVRVHPLEHPAFETDVSTLAGRPGRQPAFVMLPKVDTLAQVAAALQCIDAAGGQHLPLHVLLESPLAIHHAFDIAAHPRVQSLSFGLMDFVSAHGGAIPSSGMGVRGQFFHPLVVRAKLALASAAHAFGKVPSHCVVTEFRDTAALREAALKARNELGYTRMWSIHPDQIRTIVDAFAPSVDEVDEAAHIIDLAAHHGWGPTEVAGQLHDRASYRFYWQILERAVLTGRALPAEISHYFS
jgi:citrate lyase subunit beta/citryl-CoA lyase